MMYRLAPILVPLLALAAGLTSPGRAVARAETAPSTADARGAPASLTPRPPAPFAKCEQLPPPGSRPFAAGETLLFELDVVGVRAGTLRMFVEQNGQDLAFSAQAQSSPFFESVRQVRGKATSFTRDDSLRPLRYREDATEDGVRKWSEVVFRPAEEVDVHYAIGRRERRVRYPVEGSPHDLLSLVYYVRTLELAPDRALCLDVYGNRKLWRLEGRVVGEEWVSTPAGRYKTWHLEATARRLDRPDRRKEIHLWISQDDRRLPVAAVGEIDLGPVRAQLASDGRKRPPDTRPNYNGR